MNMSKVAWASIPLAVFVLLLGLLWQGLYRNPHEISSPLINQPLPKMSAEGLLSPKIRLSNHVFDGHLSLLHVWASWCPNCRFEHAYWMEIAHHSKIQLIGLNYKEERTHSISWLNDVGNPYLHIFYDPDGVISTNLGVYGVPETFLIDKYRMIRYKHVGPMTDEVWRQEIEPRLLALGAADAARPKKAGA